MRIVIIGNSIAGISAAAAVKQQNPQVKITIIGEERYMPYSRYLISEVLDANVKETDLYIKGADFYKDSNINIMSGRRAERLITSKNQVLLEDKTKIDYDGLIIASGVSISVPKEIKGSNKHGVLGFRTLADVRSINELIPISNAACIWGAGIAGLKAASILARKHLEVKVVTKDKTLLPGVLDERGSRYYEKLFRENGVDIVFEKEIVEIFGNGDVKAIKLDSGKVIGCGIIIVDRFYRPNIKFCEDTLLKTGQSLCVDEYLQTAVENIFAAGDVIGISGSAEFFDRPGSWDAAAGQGRIAGLNIVRKLENRQQEMEIMDHVSEPKKLEFFHLNAVSFGRNEIAAQDPGVEELYFEQEEENRYKKIILKDSKVAGYVGIGDVSGSDDFFRLMQRQVDVAAIKEKLIAEPVDAETLKPYLEETTAL